MRRFFFFFGEFLRNTEYGLRGGHIYGILLPRGNGFSVKGRIFNRGPAVRALGFQRKINIFLRKYNAELMHGSSHAPGPPLAVALEPPTGVVRLGLPLLDQSRLGSTSFAPA